MIDPELQSRKVARKPESPQKHRREIKIWVTQPKLELLESALGQLCEREPRWRQQAEALAKEAGLERLLKVLQSFKETAGRRQQMLIYGEGENE